MSDEFKPAPDVRAEIVETPEAEAPFLIQFWERGELLATTTAWTRPEAEKLVAEMLVGLRPN